MTTDAEDAVNAAIMLVASIVIGAICLLVVSHITRLAWNWSMPHLFALPEASYRNAVGLTLLAWVAKFLTARFSKE
jgi:hypothetical protein